MAIIFIIISILLFGIFSGMEIVFTSGRFLSYKNNDYSPSTIKIAEKYSDHSTIVLISCLIIKLLTLGIIAYYIFIQTESLAFNWYEISMQSRLLSLTGIAILVFAVILLEFLPKSLSRFYAEKVIPATSTLLLQLLRLLHYPSLIIQGFSTFFLKLANVPTESVTIEYTALDVERLIQEHQSYQEEGEEKLDTELFENVLFFKNIKVRECMVPRNEIVAIALQDSIQELKDVIIETNHSRILVYDDSMDSIIGYVHHFDLHKHPAQIEDILLPIEIVPEAMPLQVLLNQLIAKNKSIAWVVDEYGGTAGVVTLEDVLEEIFGEIEDEYDDNEYVEKQLSKNEYILSGRLEIDRINEEYELGIPEGDYETLSGMIVNFTGNIPEENELIKIENFAFKILNVSETKIETLKLTVEEVSNNQQ